MEGSQPDTVLVINVIYCWQDASVCLNMLWHTESKGNGKGKEYWGQNTELKRADCICGWLVRQNWCSQVTRLKGEEMKAMYMMHMEKQK